MSKTTKTQASKSSFVGAYVDENLATALDAFAKDHHFGNRTHALKKILFEGVKHLIPSDESPKRAPLPKILARGVKHPKGAK
jgi:hypothetical protein